MSWTARGGTCSRWIARARDTRRSPGLGGHGRDEGLLERADRNFIELLQELRVSLTGVQVLFAFLLTLGFMPRFERVTEFQREVYVATLLGSALTTALLITPVATHRLLFQSGRKAELVRTTHACLLVGLGALLLTMAGALLLVLDVVVGGPFAVSAPWARCPWRCGSGFPWCCGR